VRNHCTAKWLKITGNRKWKLTKKQERTKEFEREGGLKAEVLRSSDAEDFGPTVRTDSRDGGLAVLERDVHGILDLHACLALDAIGLWHAYSNCPAPGTKYYNKLTRAVRKMLPWPS